MQRYIGQREQISDGVERRPISPRGDLLMGESSVLDVTERLCVRRRPGSEKVAACRTERRRDSLLA